MTVQCTEPMARRAEFARRATARARCLSRRRSVSAKRATASPTSALTAGLLARQVLRDGEIVLLVIKPSRWFIPINAAPFVIGVAVVLIALQWCRMPAGHMRYYLDGGLFAISCRFMWSVLNWMGRLYVLTDQRILRMAGVFNLDVFDCPLRKVGRTRIVRSIHDRLLRLGTLEIYPSEETRIGSAWQMIAKPAEIHERVEAAIRKAKQGGRGGGCALAS